MVPPSHRPLNRKENTMALVRWGFESGTNGSTLTPTDAGADAVTATSGSITISTARAIEGTRSAYMDTTTTSGATFILKNITDTGQIGVDTYINIVAYPSSEAPIIWIGNGLSRQFSLAVSIDGKVRIRDAGGAGGTNLWTSTNAMALNTWYRLSAYATQNASTGTIRAAYYSGNSATPVEDSTLLTARNTGSLQYNTIRLGVKASTGTSTMTAYFDNYGYDTAATGLLSAGGSGPTANATTSSSMSFVDATTSTGTALTYGISQTAGPTKTPVNITDGKWLIPMDSSFSTSWTITVTQSDLQTATKSITIPASLEGQTQLVEMLYSTGPGVFV